MSMFPAVMMTVSLVERALLVKLFYENKGNSAAAVREFRRIKNLRRGPMSTKGIRAMIKRFEETGKLGVRPGRGRKPVTPVLVDAVKTAVAAQSQISEFGGSSARAVSRETGYSYSTVRKVLRNIMHYFPYKIHHTQQLLDRDKPQRLSFAVSFLNRMTVDLSWPWNILWSDEAHFYLNGTVNTQNCRIWAQENPRMHTEIPLHSPKVTVWCGFTATFILGPFFFEEITARGPVTCSVTGRRYHDMLQTFVVPQLQGMRVLTSTIFMQDGAPPHIHESVKALLLQHFTDERVISRFFRNPWPPRSPDLNPCDFWLWGHLKSVVYRGGVATLNDLKNSITLHVRSITTDQLRSAVEHTVHRLEILQVNEGGHMEHLSLHRPGHD